MNRIKWLDRRFDFNFPAALYPEIIERFRGAPPRLEDHLAKLEPATLTNQVEGRWSMQENAGHLLDLEPLVQQRIDEYVSGAAALHAADMSNRKTYEANYNESAGRVDPFSIPVRTNDNHCQTGGSASRSL